MTHATIDARPIAHQDDAEAYVAMVCFKHGPPEQVGVELEWTVHHRDDLERPLDPRVLASALGDHAPQTVARQSTHDPLPRGSLVTVEPGGQVEISSPPHRDVGSLVSEVEHDPAFLDALLEPAGLVRGDAGIDPRRAPSRILEVPRYSAMQGFLDRRGPWGSAMMCSTASTQICLDAGERPTAPLRFRALHSVGPALVALFANSWVVQGRRTGWVSNRLRATLGTCPPVTHPLPLHRDPVECWVERVMTAPVMCVRRLAGDWTPRHPMSFAEWLSGAGETRPTYDDLDYHLSTLFPPGPATGVRRGPVPRRPAARRVAASAAGPHGTPVLGAGRRTRLRPDRALRGPVAHRRAPGSGRPRAPQRGGRLGRARRRTPRPDAPGEPRRGPPRGPASPHRPQRARRQPV